MENLVLNQAKEIKKQFPRTILIIEFNEDETIGKVFKGNRNFYCNLNQMTMGDFIEGKGYTYYPNLKEIKIG